MKQRLYDFVARNPQGVSGAQIADHMYANDPNGGPENYLLAIRTHVFQMNKKLVPCGIAIKSCLGRGATYTLRAL